MRRDEQQLWGVALLFAAEPSDRALTGWGPATVQDGHPAMWATWLLRMLAAEDARALATAGAL